MKGPFLSQYKAVIFDMDGVLIDSEPLWKIAMMDVFTALGTSLEKKDFERTVGLRIDQVVDFWNRDQNWGVTDIYKVVDDIIDRMVDLIRQNPQPLPGVIDTLEFLEKQPIKMGLATSSPVRLIDAVLNHLNIRTFFDAIHSAEFEPYGKPHPAVYLSTAKTLALSPEHCLVIEDSLNALSFFSFSVYSTFAFSMKISGSMPLPFIDLPFGVKYLAVVNFTAALLLICVKV